MVKKKMNSPIYGNAKKTVLLTGVTGFLGSHLLSALLDEGYKVVALKRSTSNILLS